MDEQFERDFEEKTKKRQRKSGFISGIIKGFTRWFNSCVSAVFLGFGGVMKFVTFVALTPFGETIRILAKERVSTIFLLPYVFDLGPRSLLSILKFDIAASII